MVVVAIILLLTSVASWVAILALPYDVLRFAQWLPAKVVLIYVAQVLLIWQRDRYLALASSAVA